jgi:hypothetical protein
MLIHETLWKRLGYRSTFEESLEAAALNAFGFQNGLARFSKKVPQARRPAKIEGPDDSALIAAIT